MRTKDFDPNEEFAYREKHCKDGCKMIEAYLPVKRPPWYKRRIAELYAKYKCFPVSVGKIRWFPGHGDCITFIPFRGSCLGKYEQLVSKERREFFTKMINEKAPKRQRHAE